MYLVKAKSYYNDWMEEFKNNLGSNTSEQPFPLRLKC